MATLSQDLISNILEGLPVKSLLRFRCLSKPIRIEIDDAAFIDAHLARTTQTTSRLKLIFEGDGDYLYSDDLEEGQIGRPIKLISDKFKRIGTLATVGSCNGLLLLYNYYRPGEISLWNPFIRMYKKLTNFPDDSTSIFYNPLVGLGYDSDTNDYKVVIIKRVSRLCNAEVLVFSLASNAWRRLRRLQVNFDVKLPESRDNSSGTFAYGALHWLCLGDERDPCIIRIFSFDLSKEEFLQIIPPIQASHHEMPICFLRVLRPGHMFLFQEYFSHDDFINVVLYEVIKNGDTISFDWRKLHQFEIKRKDYASFQAFDGSFVVVQRWKGEVLRPLQLSEDGKKILMQPDCGVFGWYDIERRSFERLRIPGHGVYYRGIATFCWESLVSLGANSEFDGAS